MRVKREVSEFDGVWWRDLIKVRVSKTASEWEWWRVIESERETQADTRLMFGANASHQSDSSINYLLFWLWAILWRYMTGAWLPDRHAQTFTELWNTRSEMTATVSHYKHSHQHPYTPHTQTATVAHYKHTVILTPTHTHTHTPN